MGCKHSHVIVEEIGREVIQWNLVNGKVQSSTRNAGDIESTIQVICEDCGLNRSYNRYSKYLPKWVAQLIDRFENHSSEDEEEEEERVQQHVSSRGWSSMIKRNG
jgi:hypothetical protein